MTPARWVALVSGMLLGIGLVVGVNLVRGDDAGPVEALAVSADVCDDVLEGVAARYGMAIRPTQTVDGDRDTLTVCGADSQSGIQRLAVTIVAVGESGGDSVSSRLNRLRSESCADLGISGGPEVCTAELLDGDAVIGTATAFTTEDERAAVTVWFSGTEQQAPGIAQEVARLRDTLEDDSALR